MTLLGIDYTPELLGRKIAESFAPEAHEEVRRLLSEYRSPFTTPSAGPDEGHIRIQVACVRNSHGKVDALQRQVSQARTDYREVLIDAEFSRQFRRATDENQNRDRAAYLAWLTS